MGEGVGRVSIGGEGGGARVGVGDGCGGRRKQCFA